MSLANTSTKNVIEIPIYKLNRNMRLIISLIAVIIYCFLANHFYTIAGRGIVMSIVIPAGISAFLLGARFGLTSILLTGALTVYLHLMRALPTIELFTQFLPGIIITTLFVILISKWVKVLHTFKEEVAGKEEINKALEQKNEELKLYMERLESEIEEKYHAERVLAKSEEQYRNLVEKSRIGIVIDDCDGNFTYFNRQFLELLELNEEESRNFTIGSLVHPDDYERVMEIHRNRIVGRAAPERYVFRVIKKDGRTAYLEVDAVVLKSHGSVVGTRSYIWDVTDKKLAEKALSESEERFRSVFDAAPFGIYRISVDGLFVMANKAFLEMVGVEDFKEIEGTSLSQVLENEENREDFLNKLFNDKIVVDYESEWSCKSGAFLFARENAWLILNDLGTPIYADGFVEDITVRKQAEEERASLMGQLLSAKSEIKVLSGLLPICSTCKKIRNEDGSWDQLENYIDDHSEAEFSHGICPDCAKKLYPSLNL